MRQRQPETKIAPLDPIALSLALWLGMMVGVLGLQRMSEQAAAQQAAQQSAAAQHPKPAQAFVAWRG